MHKMYGLFVNAVEEKAGEEIPESMNSIENYPAEQSHDSVEEPLSFGHDGEKGSRIRKAEMEHIGSSKRIKLETTSETVSNEMLVARSLVSKFSSFTKFLLFSTMAAPGISEYKSNFNDLIDSEAASAFPAPVFGNSNVQMTSGAVKLSSVDELYQKLKYKQYFRMETHPNGGARTLHASQREFEHLSEEEINDLTDEFFRVWPYRKFPNPNSILHPLSF